MTVSTILRQTMNNKDLRDRFMAKKPCNEDFDLLVKWDVDAYDQDTGRLIFKFRKGVISAEQSALALASYRNVADMEPPSTSRASAAGELDVERLKAIRADVVGFVQESRGVGRLVLADGTELKSEVSNPVFSFLAGYGVARFTGKAVTNRISSHFPREWHDSLPFFQAIDRVHAAELPEVHALHLERIKLHPHWVIPGTALSTVTINVNYESAYHYDVGDFKPGYSTLSVVEVGEYDGGFLVFPQYRVAVDIRRGDVILNQSHMDMHGNTALIPKTEGARRISFVTYLKHRLAVTINRLDKPDGHSTSWFHGRKLSSSIEGNRDLIKTMKRARSRKK